MSDLTDSQRQKAREAYCRAAGLARVPDAFTDKEWSHIDAVYAAGYKDGHAQATAEAYCFDPKRP